MSEGTGDVDTSSPSVMIVGEQQILIVGIRHSLESDGLVVTGVAASRREATTVAAANAPDLCLVLAPLEGGVQALIDDLRAVRPELLVVVMSSEDHLDGESLVRTMAAGAAGWLSLDLPPEVLGRTLRAVHRGEPGLSRQHVGRLVAALRRPHGRATRLHDGRVIELTPREREALDLVALGLSTRSIANQLRLSTTTVRWHISGLVKKMGVQSREEAVTLYRGAAARDRRSTGRRPQRSPDMT
jgi:DNA-binding NarL/FixJ family response regulator